MTVRRKSAPTPERVVIDENDDQLKPRPMLQTVELPACPTCGGRKLRHLGRPKDRKTGKSGRFRYYECRRCTDVETESWTRFKVLVT